MIFMVYSLQYPRIESINRMPNPDGSHNICLVDIETGKDQHALLWNMKEWCVPDQSSTLNIIDIFEPVVKN